MYKFFLFSFTILALNQCETKIKNNPNKIKTVIPTPFAELPKSLDESSGLEVINGKIISMNDSGGEDELYIFNEKGKKEKTLEIKGARNKDWESLASNSTEFFIGDIGNNSGNRDNLVIYHFPLSNLGEKSVKAQKIHFQYANQNEFPYESRNHSFDGESLIALEKELVIFSKDWAKNTTQVYHIPLNSDIENLSISPSEKLQIDALITGADYDAKNKRLVLCGYKNYHNFVWIFEGATSQKFLTTSYQKVELGGLHKAQIEGVSFLNENTILFSTEKTKDFKAQLWTIPIN